MRSATVPIGWMIGCPLLQMLSDRVGRRKPVIAGGACVLLSCLACILYGPADVLPPYIFGLTADIASGASMLTYTVSKEANPPHLSGTATGVVSSLNLTFSALIGPVFAWIMERAGAAQITPLEHYGTSFQSVLYGVALAVLLTLVMKETGPVERAPLAKAGGCMNPGTGKYESVLQRCANLAAVPTAVAHPCEVSALAGALEAGEKELIVPILTFLANADSAGLVVGARVPIILTSRAGSLRSRIASCAVAVLAAHARRNSQPGIASYA